MINLELLPCNNCVYYRGIKYKGSTEKTEFVSCNKSKTGNAEDILTNKGNDISCKFQIKEYEE